MTRKIAALVAAAALGLTACATPEGLDATEAADTSTTTSSVTAEAPEARTVEPAAASVAEEPEDEFDLQSTLDEIAERAFLNTVAPYTYPSEDEALMVGYATCALLSTGSTPETLAYELLVADGPVVPGFSNDELPHFYGAAMGSLCPEYGEQFFG